MRWVRALTFPSADITGIDNLVCLQHAEWMEQATPEALTARLRYKEWLYDRLLAVKRRLRFALVRMPLTFLQQVPSTDEELTAFCGGSETRKVVALVHLTRGALSTSEYYLRLYGLVRQGLTFGLVVDADGIRGGYADNVKDVASHLYSKHITVNRLNHEHKKPKFVTAVDGNCDRLRIRALDWWSRGRLELALVEEKD